MNKLQAVLGCGMLAAVLASCSMLPDWMGEQSSTKLEGERVPAFALEQQLRPDTALAGKQVVLPPIGSEGHLALTGDLKQKKSVTIGSDRSDEYGLKAAPLVVDNILYALDGKGGLVAYETMPELKKLWRASLHFTEKKHSLAGGGVAYADGMLFVAEGAEEVVAFDAKDGHELWRRAVGNVVRAVPLAADGRLFVLTLDNRLYAMDNRDGHVLWTHAGAVETIGVFGAASPVIVSNLLVVPYSSGELYALNPASGEEIWGGNLSYSRAGNGFSLNDIDAALVVSGGTLYVGGNAGVFYAVDAASGRRLWHQELTALRGIWAAGDFLYVVDGNNQVACIHARDGGIKWVASLPRYKNAKEKKDIILLNGPVLAGERLLIASSNGVLFSLSPYDGKILQKISVPKDITQAPVVASGKVYLLSNEAKLTVLQ